MILYVSGSQLHRVKCVWLPGKHEKWFLDGYSFENCTHPALCFNQDQNLTLRNNPECTWD